MKCRTPFEKLNAIAILSTSLATVWFVAVSLLF